MFFFSSIISYSLTDDVKKHIVSIGLDKFLVNATVVDVDPKTPEQHFVKYVKRTNTSHQAYLDTCVKERLESKH